jgi:molybdate transport system substrate-binding protein
MGNTPDAVPMRLQRGEPIDVVIMVGYALSDLIKGGKVIANSRVDLARSSIGVAVRAGAPKPDISSVDALRRALLEAKSIAYSDSASGVYVSTELFKRLGIADQVAGKSRMIPAEPVGAVVARGEAEIGFQQVSELKPIAGIDLVGPLPPELQKVTIFSAGIVVGAREPEAARALIAFLASPAAAGAIKASGMEPMTSAAPESKENRDRNRMPRVSDLR